ncbi:MAG: thiol-activated cytolysin family protein [Spirochaetales bacterium]|nr:thiol-activated cytolysin family protein [Spirochaetales bacterium]
MKYQSITTILLAAIVMAGGCTIDNAPPLDNRTEINERIYDAVYAEQPQESPRLSMDESVDPESECVVTHYKVNLGWDELFLLDPAASVIWPGAIIDGSTIVTGAYKPITAKRGPLTVYCTIGNTAGSIHRDIVEPKASVVAEALNSIVMENADGTVPAQMSYTFADVYSKEQLFVEIGVNMKAGINGMLSASFTEQFRWDETHRRSKVLFKFMQIYYRCNIDIPHTPADFFDDSVDWYDIGYQISGNVSPGYVASIGYGRMALLLAESSYDSVTVKTAFKEAFDASLGLDNLGSSTTEIYTKHREVFDECDMRMVVIGGDSASATPMMTDYSQFTAWLNDARNAKVNTPVMPLSYQVRYLKDNTVMHNVLTSDSYLRNCEDTVPTPTPASGTPEPTAPPAPTPNPVTYTLTVRYIDPNHTGCNPGEKEQEYKVTNASRIYIATADKYCWSSQWNGGQVYFDAWSGDSGGIVQDRNSPMTEVYGFTGNGKLTATYKTVP